MIASGAGAIELGSWGTTFAVFAALFALSFLFSGTETAFFSLQEIDRRRILEGTSSTQRRVAGLLSNRPALITTILMGNETVNILISGLAAGLVATHAPTRPWLTVVFVTPLLVLFSEITPKILAYRFNRLWVDAVAWPMSLLTIVLLPLRVVVGGLVGALARLFHVTGDGPARRLGEDEFLAFVEQGERQGVVEEGERELIEAVFELDDLTIDRVMTPKPDMFMLPVDIGWEGLIDACREARFSRVPIYEEYRDNIVGVLLLKDLLRHRKKPLTSVDAFKRILLPPVFVPATKTANDMMKEMLRRRFHMAFVIDEHSTVIGLVSLDDLIIELVGEIEDEADDDPDEVRAHPDGGWVVQGTVDLEELAEHTGLAIDDNGDFHTLSGFVMEALDRVPEAGDRFTRAGHVFEVLTMEGRRLAEVRIRPVTDDDAEEVEA